MEGGENTVLSAYKEMPFSSSLLKTQQFYHVKLAARIHRLSDICEVLCADVWVPLCEFNSFLSKRLQCDGSVWCYNYMWFLHICCLYKWHAVNDDAVFLIVRCLSVPPFCREIITTQSAKWTENWIRLYLFSAFGNSNSFYLWWSHYSYSVHIVPLIKMADYCDEAPCHSNLHKSYTPTLTSAQPY